MEYEVKWYHRYQMLFNTFMRKLFPSWNQKAIDAIQSNYQPYMDIQEMVFKQLENLTGKEHPAVEYVRDTHNPATSVKRIVDDQWLLNWIDYEYHPFATGLYIMFEAGTLSETGYCFFYQEALDMDYAWRNRAIGYTNAPKPVKNYPECIPEIRKVMSSIEQLGDLTLDLDKKYPLSKGQ